MAVTLNEKKILSSKAEVLFPEADEFTLKLYLIKNHLKIYTSMIS